MHVQKRKPVPTIIILYNLVKDIFQQNKYTLEERVVISRSYSNNLFDIIFLSTYRLLPFRDIISSLILQTLLEFLFSIVPSIDPNSG